MNPRERELLTGMGNCYEACHADFEGTVAMVADARHLRPDEVLGMLGSIRERFGTDPEYLRLRARVPPEFPL